MKRVAIAAMMLILCFGGRRAFAGPFGPSTPDFEDAPVVGAGYFHSGVKWKPSGGRFGGITVRQDEAYLEISDAVEPFTAMGRFLRLGAADFDDGADFKAGMKPFAAAGIRNTWYVGDERTSLKVGTVLRGSYFPGYEQEKTFLPGTPVKAKIKGKWDVALGVPVEKRLSETATLYVGPTISYGRMKVTREAGGIKESTAYKLDGNLGVFGGARIAIRNSFSLGVEGQFQGGISGGVSFAYSY